MSSFNHGSMANAMPQAIGAQFAFPNRQVISMSGDGGFTMLMGDLLTLVQYEFADQIARLQQQHFGHDQTGNACRRYGGFRRGRKEHQFARLAEAVGIRGFRVEDSQD